MAPQPKQIRVSLDLDEDVKKKFAIICVKKGKKQNQVLKEFVMQYIKQRGDHHE